MPSAIQTLLDAAGIPDSVQVVNLAGEALKTTLVDRLYANGVAKVYDLYGPSEATTYATFTQRMAGEAANIGGPVGNTQVYLLDHAQQLAPLGVVAEIYLGGAV